MPQLAGFSSDYRPRWRLRGHLVSLLLATLLALPAATRGQERLRYAGWQLEWAEEFSSPAAADSAGLAGRWRFAYPWGRNLTANPETQYYLAEQVRPGPAGTLVLGARKLAQPRPYLGRSLRYEAGMLYSYHPADSLRPVPCPPSSDGFSYGLFEVRCRQPAGPAAFPAFWLFGGVPDEVDIFEAASWGTSNNVHLNSHEYWRPTTRGGETCQCFFFNADPAANLHQQYHTYSLSWLPGELIFYFDGFPIRRETRYVPLGCPMALILNLAMLNWSEVPRDSLLVDYVRVYRPGRAQRQQPGTLAPPTVRNELAHLPRLAPRGPDPDLAARQHWELRRPTPPATRLQLELLENRNPACFSFLALPWAGEWAPAWRLREGESELLLTVADSLPLHWTLTDHQGAERRRGTIGAGRTSRLDWHDLEPGTYLVRLQVGQTQRWHPLHVLGRATGSQPTAEWLAPATAAEKR